MDWAVAGTLVVPVPDPPEEPPVVACAVVVVVLTVVDIPDSGESGLKVVVVFAVLPSWGMWTQDSMGVSLMVMSV